MLVVITSPGFDDDTGCVDRPEEILAETLVTEPDATHRSVRAGARETSGVLGGGIRNRS